MFLLAVLSLMGQAMAQVSASGDVFRNMSRPVKVCVAEVAPMIYCDPNKPPSSFTGHDIEMFRMLGTSLEVNEGVDYEFHCVPFLDIIESLKTLDGRCRNCDDCSEQSKCKPGCDLGLSGITITISRQEQGILFSDPYYKAALAILVQGSINSSSGWAWKDPFTAGLWLITICTLIIFPVVVFVLEFCSLKPRVHRRDVHHGVMEASWRSMWSFLHGDRLDVTSISARVAVGSFAFMALILSSTYTANLAAFLTVKQINSAVRSVSDLRGKAVASTAVYIPRLRSRHGVVATDPVINNDADLYRVVDGVADGTYAAFIWDEPVIKYVASNHTSCKLRPLPDSIEPFDFGIGFRTGTDARMVQAFSSAIVTLQESGDLSTLKQNFISGAGSACESNADVDTDTQSVTFSDLYGLWVILGAATVLGVVLCLLTRRIRKKKWRAADLEDGPCNNDNGAGEWYPQPLELRMPPPLVPPEGGETAAVYEETCEETVVVYEETCEEAAMYKQTWLASAVAAGPHQGRDHAFRAAADDADAAQAAAADAGAVEDAAADAAAWKAAEEIEDARTSVLAPIDLDSRAVAAAPGAAAPPSATSRADSPKSGSTAGSVATSSPLSELVTVPSSASALALAQQQQQRQQRAPRQPSPSPFLSNPPHIRPTHPHTQQQQQPSGRGAVVGAVAGAVRRVMGRQESVSGRSGGMGSSSGVSGMGGGQQQQQQHTFGMPRVQSIVSLYESESSLQMVESSFSGLSRKLETGRGKLRFDVGA